MTTTSNEEFAKRMMLLARPAAEFEPTASYDKDGDCLEFLAKPDQFYGERVDDVVTVYYSQNTQEVIGSLLKGVKRLCSSLNEKGPGFRISIEDGPVRLEYLFLAQMWLKEGLPDADGIATLAYKKLREMARETEVEIEAGDLCCV